MGTELCPVLSGVQPERSQRNTVYDRRELVGSYQCRVRRVKAMAYDYQTERPRLFTEAGQEMFLKVRDKSKELLDLAGAFRAQEVLSGICGDSWMQIACIDRLVELKEIVEIPRDCWTQYKIYSSPQVHNR